jgi:hypothetical protein
MTALIPENTSFINHGLIQEPKIPWIWQRLTYLSSRLRLETVSEGPRDLATTALI